MPYKMQPGNVFTIEPIFMMRDAKVPYMWEDDFTMLVPGVPSGKFIYEIIIIFESSMGTHSFDYRDRI